MLAPCQMLVLLTLPGPVFAYPVLPAAVMFAQAQALGHSQPILDWAAPATGKQTGTPPAQKADPRLEQVLASWEKANREIRDAHCVFSFTREDAVFRKKTVERGEAWSKKLNLLRLERKTDKGVLKELLVATGDQARVFDFELHRELVWKHPPGFPDSGPVELWLLGEFARHARLWIRGVYLEFPVAEAKASLDVSLFKEDANCGYLTIKPRTKADQHEFRIAYVVLNKKTYTPRMIVLDENLNGSRMIWDFERFDINVNPPISRESIAKDLPKGFDKVVFPRDATK